MFSRTLLNCVFTYSDQIAFISKLDLAGYKKRVFFLGGGYSPSLELQRFSKGASRSHSCSPRQFPPRQLGSQFDDQFRTTRPLYQITNWS